MLEIKEYLFDLNEEFESLLISLHIGESQSNGSDVFYLNFIKADVEPSDIKLLEEFNIYLRAKGLFISNNLNEKLIGIFLKRLVTKLSDETWEKSVNQLTCYFDWEFDNYQA